jgi:hypothetical protein
MDWLPHSDINWLDKDYNQFNIDTRDFHASRLFKEERHKDFETLKKYPRFFFTGEELKELIDRLYVESGGVGEWRYLELVSNDKRVLNWNLKYIRIFKTELGFIVCNDDNVAIPKDVFTSKVNQEYLHHH